MIEISALIYYLKPDAIIVNETILAKEHDKKLGCVLIAVKEDHNQNKLHYDIPGVVQWVEVSKMYIGGFLINQTVMTRNLSN